MLTVVGFYLLVGFHVFTVYLKIYIKITLILFFFQKNYF